MTFDEFNSVLKEKGVRHYRFNGFEVYFPDLYYTVVEGKFPLPLARKICEGIDNSKLRIRIQGGNYAWNPDEYATNVELSDIIDDMMESKLFTLIDYEAVRENYIRNLEEKNQLDNVYVTKYYVDTADGLRHLIDCIDESGYENEIIWS